MKELVQSARSARRLIGLNRLLVIAGWSLTVAAGVFAVVVTCDRSFALGLPLGLLAGGLAALAIVVAMVWSLLTRPTLYVAAAALDGAAGLRERLSSSLYCHASQPEVDDPFVDAVHADALRVCRNITPRAHLRVRAPSSWWYCGSSIALAACLLLLPEGMLLNREEDEQAPPREEILRVKATVENRLDKIRKIVKTNPALKDLEKQLEPQEQPEARQMDRPETIRNDAVKRVDRLADTLRQRREDDKFAQLEQFKKMMRRIQEPGSNESPVQKLQQALAKGDLESAKERVKELQERLATLESEGDKEKIEQMRKQLDDLAKQIEAAAEQKELQRKLEQAGIPKKDLERMLQQLTKKDIEDIQKKLQEQGMSQKDIQKLTQQLQKQSEAGQAMKQLSKAMQQAASKMSQGSQGMSAESMAALESAAEQLSEMEMLEQEMQSLDSAMSEMQSARNDLGSRCSSCGGSGMKSGQACSACNGTGMGQGGQGQGKGGMGQQAGQGRGGLAQEEATATRMQKHRQRVESRKGRIVGQFLVDGEQIKGDVQTSLSAAMAAEQREMTERIVRDRIPRQYQKSVKEYFSSIQHQLDRAVTIPEPPSSGDPAEADVEAVGAE